MPRPLLGRCLLIELWPLKPGEEVAEVKPFDQELMDAFKTLRRKSLRWSNDNESTLKDAEPLFPAGFTTRPRANAKLLLAIAELAGSDWAEQARAALDKLLRETRTPSWLDLLLEELWVLFVIEARKDIRSAALVKRLTADPTSEWCEYGRGHRVTEREVAALLRKLHIRSASSGFAAISARIFLKKRYSSIFCVAIRSSAHPTWRRRAPHHKMSRRRKKASG